MSSKNRGLHNIPLFSLFSFPSTQGKQGKQACFCHFARLHVLGRGKDDAAGGGDARRRRDGGIGTGATDSYWVAYHSAAGCKEVLQKC